MTHHKRGRPKHRRAGCLLCKPHKDERAAKVAGSKAAVVALAEPVDALEEEHLRSKDEYDDDDFYDYEGAYLAALNRDVEALADGTLGEPESPKALATLLDNVRKP